VDPGQVGAPVGHRLAVEQPQGLQPGLQHPFGFALLRRDVADDVFVQATTGAGARGVRVRPAVLVTTQRGQGLFLVERLGDRGGALLGSGSHPDSPPYSWLFLIFPGELGFGTEGAGTWVVQAASPRAIVASRWTCVPR